MAASNALQELVQEALRLLPGLSGELAAAAGTVASNLAQVVDACVAAASRAGSDPAMMHNVLGECGCRPVCCLGGRLRSSSSSLLCGSWGFGLPDLDND